MQRAIALLASTAAILLGGAAAASAATPPTLPTQDPFYSYSGSLAGAAPGAVLKTRKIALVDSSLQVPAQATQVLYRTNDELGQPAAAVATIIQPLLGVLPYLVSYQTAYDGLGAQCDPSYTLRGGSSGDPDAAAEEQLITGYVAAGYTVVIPDYEGLGQDWGAGQEAGFSTLDGIRAAEKSLALNPAGTRVAMVGYSGGSIPTEFASELQPNYAPDIDLVGTAEGGIPVDFAHNLNYINGSSSWSGVIPAVLVGLGRAFNINISDYASSYGNQVAGQVQGECINSFYGAYPGLTIQSLLKPQYQNFLGIPLIATLTNLLTMGTVGTPQGPLFMGVGNSDGTGDGVMVAGDVEALAHGYCQQGVHVQFQEYRGKDHSAAAAQFEPAALSFVTERLLGFPVPNDCRTIPTGNSLAPLPVASLVFRILGASKNPHKPGIVFGLRAKDGVLTGLLVQMHRGKRLTGSASVPQVGPHRHKVTLPLRKAGHYLVTVTQGPATLLTLKLHVR
jgi:hypothetical protein